MQIKKKFDHLNFLKLGLAISIFSIGYLITMFYFQINELIENHKRIVTINTLSNNFLTLESEIDHDIYFTQSQLLNINIATQNTVLDNKYIEEFIQENKILNELDDKFSEKVKETKALLVDYLNHKNQLITSLSISNTSRFNHSVYKLQQNTTNFNELLVKKTNIYNNNNQKLISQTNTSGFLIALISLVIFVLSYVKMNENLLELKKINDEVVFMNQTLNNAEMVAGFGSWKVNIEENKYILSDNFYRLLGVEPKGFESSLANILRFIHPEDREMVQKLHANSFGTKESTSISYRYLLADGTIKHMLSVGQFLNNPKGQLIKIGVNQDITDLMKKSIELEDKNSKLTAMNSDLESFNNIVSHDLQEPLRKIQMFISRIESSEFKETASENTIGYFNKIKLSAQRMQNLMTDLVDYSRTIKDDRIFEQVELNTIFEEILEELSLRIEEKNATIFIDNLPTVLGTRFQIQQLFVNLISNALKYVKSDVAPIISIRLEIFNNAIVNEKTISSNDFHKITVSDNGIGFEQKYADKIFMLFKRLETDQSYQGTGLGLAICKKIVDNNNGYITAEGIPNQGSVFTVYLPKLTSLNV